MNYNNEYKDNGQAERIETREIFSNKVQAGSRTYYFDIKKNRRNDSYLVVSESKRLKEEGKIRHHIMVFEEDIEKFAYSFFKSLLFFMEDSKRVSATEINKLKDNFNLALETMSALNSHRSFAKRLHISDS